jgi:hypothetical protein
MTCCCCIGGASDVRRAWPVSQRLLRMARATAEPQGGGQRGPDRGYQPSRGRAQSGLTPSTFSGEDQCRRSEPVLPAQIRHRHARLLLPQDRDDLLLGEP